MMKTSDEPAKEYEGTLRVTGKGVGYVETEEFDDDIKIAPGDLNTGLHRDRVKVLLHPKRRDDQQTGEITEILFRYKSKFVGTVKRVDGAVFVIPDDTKMYTDILLPEPETHKAKDGEKVYVRIAKWDDPKMNPLGEIVTVIGTKGNNDVEMKAIVLEKGLATSIPEDVEKEAAQINKTISAEEVAKRRDMRGILTFTIDPADAKDFDDAISYQKIENGDIEVGVHIADVSHYVRPDTALDKEAAERGTSIYLVDRTIPMLPEILSNELCSLRPNEDKLTFSAIFTFSQSALAAGKTEIISQWFGRTVIHSNKRFTYEEAQEVLDRKAGPHCVELTMLNNIAKILQKERFENGAISFESEEVKFKLDEFGKPLGVYIKERQDTNKLIEDLMLLANKKVAEFIGKKDKNVERTFVYRVHDVPNKDKIAELTGFLKTLGYELKSGQNGPRSKDINKMLNDVRGTAEEGLIQTAAIRSMAKAIYTTKNIGHFGLSFSHYTHFTSPIRRYPDIMVHRLLAEYLAGHKVSKEQLQQFEASSRYSSEMEQTAADAERGSIKYKQVEYMQNKIGQEFEGVISGVTEWGIYVEEKKTKAEGLIHVKNLAGDFYSIDTKNYALIGERTKKRYRLGDPIRFRLKSADLDRRQLDFEVVK